MNKKKIFLMVIMMISLGVIYYKATYVAFYDKEFERYVREHMFVEKNASYIFIGKQEISATGLLLRKDVEMSEGGIYIDLYEYDIRDLRDLKKFKNLGGFSLVYLPGKEIKSRVDVPQNFNVISKMKKIKTLDLCGVNVGSETLDKVVETVESLTITRCLVGGTGFEENFPRVNFLWLEDSNISSLEFLEKMEELKILHLDKNTYECSIQALASLPNLEKLKVFSDEPEIFGLIPEIPTVKELQLGGKAKPPKEEIEKYLKWGGLERIALKKTAFEKLNGNWVETKSE